MVMEYGYLIALNEDAWQVRFLRSGHVIECFLFRFGNGLMDKEQAFEEATRAGQGFVEAQNWWDDTMCLRDRTVAVFSSTVSETRQ